MKFPTTVLVNSVPWVVLLQSAKDLWSASGKDLLGQCVYEEAAIMLREGMTPQRLAQVLFHELVPAVDGDAQINLSEQHVAALANGLLSLLRDNPELVAFLTARSDAPAAPSDPAPATEPTAPAPGPVPPLSVVE